MKPLLRSVKKQENIAYDMVKNWLNLISEIPAHNSIEGAGSDAAPLDENKPDAQDRKKQEVMMEQTIRAIFFQDGDAWVAQCLEYDIGAQGPTLDETEQRFQLTLEIEYRESKDRHGTAFAGIAPAPAYYQEMWHKRSKSFTPDAPGRSNIPVSLDLALCA